MIKNKKQENNFAFIDGQNLYMGTTKSSKKRWKVDLKRLRVYLRDKYKVSKAFYFLGYVEEANNDLYEKIQDNDYILMFREHNSAMLGKKKGNVDSDIIFNIMKKMYKKEPFDKIVLISGDGDYKKLVDFLIEEKKLKKILFPNKEFSSSLYKEIGSEYFDCLENKDIKSKILKRKRLLRH